MSSISWTCESVMLAIDRLTKIYRGSSEPALDSVSFSVLKGGFVALLGPNGAGKSTLINILAGRVGADSGSVRIHGERLSDDNPRLRALIGIVPQEIRFDFVFTVEELLRLEMGFYGQRRDDEYIRHLLERLSLADKRKVNARALSGGMQRRLMIARALVHRPRLLLLDEPTAGVDLHLRHEMHAYLQELSAGGLTIVLTTHYLEEAQRLCDRVVVLDRGRLVADESRDAFLRLAGDFLTVEIQARAVDQIKPLLEFEGALLVQHTADRLRFIVPGSSRHSLLRKLAAASEQIDSFQILEPSLGEAFTKLTRREGRAHERVA